MSARVWQAVRTCCRRAPSSARQLGVRVGAAVGEELPAPVRLFVLTDGACCSGPAPPGSAGTPGYRRATRGSARAPSTRCAAARPAPGDIRSWRRHRRRRTGCPRAPPPPAAPQASENAGYLAAISVAGVPADSSRSASGSEGSSVGAGSPSRFTCVLIARSLPRARALRLCGYMTCGRSLMTQEPLSCACAARGFRRVKGDKRCPPSCLSAPSGRRG